MIHFKGPYGRYGEFSNLYPAPTMIREILFGSVEHYYQAHKFSNSAKALAYSQLIVEQPTPIKALFLGNQQLIRVREISSNYQSERLRDLFLNSDWDDPTDKPNYEQNHEYHYDLNETIQKYIEVQPRDDWITVQDNILRTAVFHKFFQNSKLRQVLFSTQNQILIYNNERDSHLGTGSDGNGQNM